MPYAIHIIAQLINAEFINAEQHKLPFTQVAFDTRKISNGDEVLFFALSGVKSDGHAHLSDAYTKGVRNFVVTKDINLIQFPDANFLKVRDSLAALQTLAQHHRSQLSLPFIAITGSNGKTIVKEWLATALSAKRKTTKTPLSYNSQIGVPYSILSLDTTADLAIIEAGISQEGEMKKLEKIIKPHIGIITNIGDAHSSGFKNIEEKTAEKISLFRASEIIIYNKDTDMLDKALTARMPHRLFSWGYEEDADLKIKKTDNLKQLTLAYGHKVYNLSLPQLNPAYFENAMQVISYLILDGWTAMEIQEQILHFSTLPNRLEIRNGHNNNVILNDSYSSDKASLELAFAQLNLQSEDKKKVAILSALDHQKDQTAYQELIKKLATQNEISALITIGFDLKEKAISYKTTEECLEKHDWNSLSDSAILIKGASRFQLATIADRLTAQVHQTILETNLSAIAHNLNYYRKKLEPSTLVMAVIKAQAYGSGSMQLAQFLEQQKVDYLGVALIDEAIELRKGGCHIPIMVFNVQQKHLRDLWTYNLEPEVYSFEILEELIKYGQKQTSELAIHLKVETGMNRLGFTEQENARLAALLPTSKLQVRSIFSHLASSENPKHDPYTTEQAQRFQKAYDTITQNLGYKPRRHLLNSAGTRRFPQYQFEMVRIGLGLYGYDGTEDHNPELQAAHKLTARVLQIKTLHPGQSTGYGRSGKVSEKTEIAIISIGYADGLMRAAGNGKTSFLIKGLRCPTIGIVCMDVTMVKVPEIGVVKAGDNVLIYGKENPINKLATACNTISYEIISRISPRVKRTYIHE